MDVKATSGLTESSLNGPQQRILSSNHRDKPLKGKLSRALKGHAALLVDQLSF